MAPNPAFWPPTQNQRAHMKFNKLRLLGFKSFVDPTELVIADGLTGVVGPNGCGKSNLLEALRWVMGENRAKAMRGSGMEDVIFNGASARPARNYAEVTLSLDNSERLAPAAFNTSDSLDIVRRITRDAGSAYKVSGKDVRARDVQMLFADASTGAHSPALVRQGQISELVNAKPKARRRVLEEAAGISGLYQRRHEAELKLNSTEVNLARVDDVLEQLANQLGSLARQAKQAARYREIAEELRLMEGVLLFRRWAEAEAAFKGAEAELTEATRLAGTRQGDATAATTARLKAEETVPPLREEEAIASAVYQRLIVERDAIDAEEARAKDAIETLTARLSQLNSDREREAALGHDAEETITSLEWEAKANAEASVGHEGKLAAMDTAAKQAMATLQGEESTLDRATEDLARLEARHQALERRFTDARDLDARMARDVENAESAVAKARNQQTEAETRYSEMSERSAAAQDAASKSEATLAEAESARATAQAREAETRAARSEAEGEAKALRAETSALERLLARETSDDGQIIDQITVGKGFETAFGAALADDLKAPEISGDIRAGWARLDPYPEQAALPDGATRLADHISAPAALSRRLAAIGLVDRADGDRLQASLCPGQRLVSREGDLWRWDGYRSNADDTPSAAALLLQQRNRLADLTEALSLADAKGETAEAEHKAAAEALSDANSADRAAREARKAADSAATEAVRQLGRAEADVSLLKGQIETLSHTVERRQEEAKAAADALAAAESELAGLDDLSDQRQAIEGLKIAVASARAAMLDARGAADDARREEEARTKRRQEIQKELSGWALRQKNAATRIAEFAARIDATERDLRAASEAPEEIRARRDKLAGGIADAETRRQTAADALAEGETALRQAEDAERQAERQGADAREARARAEAVAEAAAQQLAAAAERINEDMDVTPEALLQHLELDPDAMPPAERAEMDVARLKRQRDSLGAVNLRAEEDAAEVQTEHDALAREKDDLTAAVATLKDGIESLNTEGRSRLLEAFDGVNKNFSQLFKHLFGGGEANLVLVESDDPLEAGLEIMCQPPGKKLATLSLLSGGEQTLTALSLIFAVFLANPSPICVLDEVDAPLDDANVGRFCDLLEEMTRKTDTRFLIITHHAVTMSRMDRLFGVTMAEQGVSQLVSVDLNQAEQLVA